MRKSLDSHYIEEVVYFANEGADTNYNQITPTLSDFKVERLSSGIYALTPKFKIDQKPGEKRPMYCFVKAILELGEQAMRSAEDIYTVIFYFPFPKGEIVISEIDDEVGELGDNTDFFKNVVFYWSWGQNISYGKTFNEGVLAPSLVVIDEDGITIGNSVSSIGYFYVVTTYKAGVPFANCSGYTWGD